MICTRCSEEFTPTPFDLKQAEDLEMDPCCPLCRVVLSTQPEIRDLRDAFRYGYLRKGGQK